MVSLSFSSPVYLWTGYGSIVYNSITYQGLGSLGTISTIEETSDLSAKGITMQLSGVPTSLISIALTEDYQGRNCSVMFGVLNNSSALVSDPIIIFSGRMDVMTINDDGQTASISMNAENRLVDFRRAREVRYTDAEQKNLYPSDKGLEFVNAIQEKEIYWGSSNYTAPVIDNSGLQPNNDGLS
jgi:hypothetical protein